jgi:carboxyl-terminal processing protease
VVPDIVVAPAAADDNALLLRETDLAKHLPALQQEGEEGGRTQVEPTRMFGTRKDKALRTAVALLKPEDGRGGPFAALLRRLRGKQDKVRAGTAGIATAAVTDVP